MLRFRRLHPLYLSPPSFSLFLFFSPIFPRARAIPVRVGIAHASPCNALSNARHTRSLACPPFTRCCSVRCARLSNVARACTSRLCGSFSTPFVSFFSFNVNIVSPCAFSHFFVSLRRSYGNRERNKERGDYYLPCFFGLFFCTGGDALFALRFVCGCCIQRQIVWGARGLFFLSSLPAPDFTRSRMQLSPEHSKNYAAAGSCRIPRIYCARERKTRFRDTIK